MSPREASTKPDRGNGSERGGCREGFPKDSIQTKVMKNLLHGTSYLGILCKEFVNQAEKKHVEGKNTKDCNPSRQDQKYIFFRDCAENSWIKLSTQWLIMRQSARSLIPLSQRHPAPCCPVELPTTVLQAQRRPPAPGPLLAERAWPLSGEPGWRGRRQVWRGCSVGGDTG